MDCKWWTFISKLRSYSVYWPEGFAPSCTIKIFFNILARGGGSFDRSSKYFQVKIGCNILAKGVAVLIPHEDNLKLRSDSIYWPEGVAVLIPD